jgi:hypothetical protein
MTKKNWRDSDPIWIYSIKMMNAYEAMTHEERAEVHQWERENLDGCTIGTQNWPGWEPLIGKYPYPESKPKRTKRSQSRVATYA